MPDLPDSAPDILREGGAQYSARHREVLRAALFLFAERGWAGASLRELARRLGVAQPSLYHYFRSKEELVEQIIETFGFGGVLGTVSEPLPFPSDVAETPPLLADYVLALYERTDWPVFVRFVFNIALEERWRERLRAMFVDRTRELMVVAISPYVQRGQISAEDGMYLGRMITSAVALPLIEQHVCFPGAGEHPDVREYAAWVGRFAEEALRARIAARADTAASAYSPPARKSKNSRA